MMPKTKYGWYAVGFFFAFVLLALLFALLVKSGQRGGATFFENLWLAIPGLSAALCAIMGFVFGSISIARYRERAISVFIATIFGFLMLVWVSLEILFPH